MFVGMIVPHFWTTLHDNVITWFALIEGFLLPFSMYLTDESFRETVKMAFRRSSSPSYTHDSSGCKSIYKPPLSTNFMGKPGFSFQYNDFAMINKPYLGLMKSPEPNRSPSALNGRLRRQESLKRSNCKLVDMMMGESGMNPYKSGHYMMPKKPLLTRNNSQLSYVLSHSNKAPFGGAVVGGSGLDGHHVASPFLINTLMSNFTPGENSIRKKDLPWSCSSDSNWRLSSSVADKKLNIENTVIYQQQHQDPVEQKSRQLHASQRNHDEHEHIYATLKIRRDDDASSTDAKESKHHANGKLPGKSCKKNQLDKKTSDAMDDNSVSGISFTTNANDDFEFHDTRNVSDTASGVNNLPNQIRESMEFSKQVDSGDSSSSSDVVSVISSESSTSSDFDTINKNDLKYRKHANLFTFSGQARKKTGVASSQAFGPLESKRKGWQFFSTSDLHLLDSKAGGYRQDPHPARGRDLLPGHLLAPGTGACDRPFKNSGVGMGISGISYRRTMSETNLSPLSQATSSNGSGWVNRDKAIYVPVRPLTSTSALVSALNYHQHQHQFNYPTNASHRTNDTGTSNSTNSSNYADKSNRFFAPDKQLSRICSFSKNRPRIRAQKYQLHRRPARRQESAKEIGNLDYRRFRVGSRFSLTHHDLDPKELATFVSVKSMPDLTVGNYLPIYNYLKK